jgi:hypothetical protein
LYRRTAYGSSDARYPVCVHAKTNTRDQTGRRESPLKAFVQKPHEATVVSRRFRWPAAAATFAAVLHLRLDDAPKSPHAAMLHASSLLALGLLCLVPLGMWVGGHWHAGTQRTRNTYHSPVPSGPTRRFALLGELVPAQESISSAPSKGMGSGTGGSTFQMPTLPCPLTRPTTLL